MEKSPNYERADARCQPMSKVRREGDEIMAMAYAWNPPRADWEATGLPLPFGHEHSQTFSFFSLPHPDQLMV
jgi:hypothetical protein